MNDKRRKNIARCMELLERTKSRLEELQQEEQDYLDNTPEGFWGSDRYSRSEDAIDCLQDAIDSIQYAIDSAESAKDL